MCAKNSLGVTVIDYLYPTSANNEFQQTASEPISGVIKRESAQHGLLNDDELKLHDHFWSPYEHENRGCEHASDCWVGKFFS
jgi:hypothetical protein